MTTCPTTGSFLMKRPIWSSSSIVTADGSSVQFLLRQMMNSCHRCPQKLMRRLVRLPLATTFMDWKVNGGSGGSQVANKNSMIRLPHLSVSVSCVIRGHPLSGARQAMTAKYPVPCPQERDCIRSAWRSLWEISAATLPSRSLPSSCASFSALALILKSYSGNELELERQYWHLFGVSMVSFQAPAWRLFDTGQLTVWHPHVANKTP